jgi:hypothetical protein
MIVPTCWPRSAAVSRPGTSPFTTLHALDVPRVRHDVEERAIDRQRAWNFKRNAGRLTTGSVGGRDGTIECDLAMGQMAHISAQSDPRPL